MPRWVIPLLLLVASLAVVGEIAPPAWRGRYMGFFGLSETLGMSAGPLVGGILLDSFPAEPYFIWGTIALIACIAAAGFYRWNISSQARK